MLKHKVGILVIVGFLIYANALFNGFVWDDEEQIVNNTQVHSLASIPGLFFGSTFYNGGAANLSGLYYKPFMMASFALIAAIFGPAPFAFHLFGIVLHIGNSVIVYFLFRRLLKRDMLSFGLAMVFLVHPMNTEAVLYASALQDLLFFFFGTLALLVGRPVLSALLLLCSLLSKETGAVMVVLTGFFSLLFRPFQITRRLGIAILGVLAMYAWLRFGVANIFVNKHGIAPISTLPFTGRLLNVPALIVYYLKTYIFPVNLAISQQWIVQSASREQFVAPLAVAGVFLLIGAGMAVWLWRTKSPWLRTYVFFTTWFWVALGFHLQLFPLDMTVSDRWFYLPMVGLLGMTGIASILLMERVHGTERLRRWAWFLFVAVIILLGLRTVRRTFDWRDGLALYSHDIAISRDAFDLENNYGVELFRRGKYDEAALHFQTSITLAPTWWTSYNNLGAYYERRGDVARAEELYKTSIANGTYYLAWENLGMILIREKKYTEAVTILEKTLSLLPQNPRVMIALSLAYYQTGQKDKARATASRLLALEPTAQNNMLLLKMANNEDISY